jgi:Fe-S-cluster containining protein
VVTDLVEIRGLTKGREAENLRFRRYVRNHHQDEGAFRVLAKEVEAQIDCTRCANCCRQTVVEVSDLEIAKIAGYLGMEPAEVIRLYTTIDDPDARGTRVIINRRNGCTFLDGNLCTVYDARPEACRRFPHLVNAQRSLGSRMASIFRRASYCPIVYNTLEAYST